MPTRREIVLPHTRLIDADLTNRSVRSIMSVRDDRGAVAAPPAMALIVTCEVRLVSKCEETPVPILCPTTTRK